MGNGIGFVFGHCQCLQLPAIEYDSSGTRSTYPTFVFEEQCGGIIFRNYSQTVEITYRLPEEGVNNTRRVVSRGIPQRYVLGPLLRYMRNNTVSDAPVSGGLYITCYADDSLIVAGGISWSRTTRILKAAVTSVVSV